MGEETTVHTVLVEVDDGIRASWLTDVLNRAGFAVDVCLGPYDLPDGVCPLAAGEECEAAAGADVILYGLRGPHEQVLAAEREHLPDVPVVLQAFPDEVDELGEVAEGLIVSSPFDREQQLVEKVRGALAVRAE